MSSFYITIGILVIAYFFYKEMKANKSFQNEMDRISSLDTERKKIEIVKLQTKRESYKTNHVLHLLLSIFTLSLWVIPWFFIAQSNGKKRYMIDRYIEAI